MKGDAFTAGRVVGGVVGAVVGLGEADTGASMVVGGISGGAASCAETLGAGCVAGVSVAGAGAAVTAVGVATAGNGINAAVEQANILFSSGSYRDRFYKQYPNAPKGDPIHHRIPQKARDLGLFTSAEVDSVDNLRAVPFDTHTQITTEWGQFWRQNPNATRQDVLDFANHIDATYGQSYYQP